MYYLTAGSVDNIIRVIYILLTISKIHIQGISCTVWTELKWTIWTSTADFCDQRWISGFHNRDQQPSSTQTSATQKPWVGLGFFDGFPPFCSVFGSPSMVSNTNICQVVCHTIQPSQFWPLCSYDRRIQTAVTYVQLPYPSFWHTQFHTNSVSFVILPHPSSSTRPQTFLKSIPSKNLSRQSCLWNGPCFTTKSSIQNNSGFSR